METQNLFTVSEQGYYGQFGGAHVPETLLKCTQHLAANYIKYLNDADFKSLS